MPLRTCENAQDNLDLQHLHVGAHFGHAFSNNNKGHPMTCGLFTVAGSEPIVWTFPADEFIIGLEGEFHVEDVSKPGELITLKTGDIMHADKGTKTKWTSPTKGKAFYAGQYGPDEFEDIDQCVNKS